VIPAVWSDAVTLCVAEFGSMGSSAPPTAARTWLTRVVSTPAHRSGSACCARPAGRARAARTGGQAWFGHSESPAGGLTALNYLRRVAAEATGGRTNPKPVQGSNTSRPNSAADRARPRRPRQRRSDGCPQDRLPSELAPQQVSLDDPHAQAVEAGQGGAIGQVLEYLWVAGGLFAGQQHRPVPAMPATKVLASKARFSKTGIPGRSSGSRRLDVFTERCSSSSSVDAGLGRRKGEDVEMPKPAGGTKRWLGGAAEIVSTIANPQPGRPPRPFAVRYEPRRNSRLRGRGHGSMRRANAPEPQSRGCAGHKPSQRLKEAGDRLRKHLSNRNRK
jgi:hypothetical protein